MLEAEKKGIKKMRQWEQIFEMIAVFLAVIVINLLAQKSFFRIDLTQDNRYTMSEAAKRIVRQLDDEVYITVYLDGELNAQFKRLQKAVRENLEELKAVAGNKIRWHFVNPDELTNASEKKAFFEDLAKKGLPPTTLFEVVNGKKIQKVILPGVMIAYKNKEKAVLLLKGNKNFSPAEQINHSVENIEYELISAIQKLTSKNKKSIAVITGNDELRPEDLYGFYARFSENYIVEPVNPLEKSLDNFDLIIWAQPKKRIPEKTRYLVDQYIMRGGKAVFLTDKVQMNLDSIANGGTFAFGYDLGGLEDLLFRYGIRVNIDLVQDQQAGAIVVNVGQFGENPNLQRVPWPYNVVANAFNDKHPIARHLDKVYFRFVSSLDTVKAPTVKKTPLIFSSKYSRIKNCPTKVDLDELKADLNKEIYKKSHLPLAYLLEGKFKSGFSARFPPEGFEQSKQIKNGKESKILVIGDGDFIRNETDKKTGKPLPLGIEPLINQSFDNGDFMENAVAYMLDPEGVIASRKKEIIMRPLDSFRIQSEKEQWQTVNIALPIGAVLLFGVFNYWRRKRKYEKF
jgi:gliding-associated putative ABC transporter substrate-binding component GldG